MRCLSLLSICLLSTFAEGATPTTPSSRSGIPASLPAAFEPATRPLPELPEYHIKRTTGPIVIDGKVDDIAWGAANTIELMFPWPEQTGPKQKTTVRMLYDDERLFISYVCEDTEVTAIYKNHDDPTYKDDCVEVFINPDETQNFYYGLEMNALATLFDYFFLWPKPNLLRYDMVGVTVGATIDGQVNNPDVVDTGWSLEVAIPFKNFSEFAQNLPPKPGDTWRANLARWDGVAPNRCMSLWCDSGLKIPGPHNPSRFGRLIFD